jgi:hypothetical protein
MREVRIKPLIGGSRGRLISLWTEDMIDVRNG